MAFGMFTTPQSPIAIDFGSSSVKLMQLDRGEKPKLLAAAELPIPASIRRTPQHVFAHMEVELPALLKSAGFKGKRVVTAIPPALTYIQHMQIAETPGVRLDEIVLGQLQMQMNCAPGALVVRCIPVPDAKCRDNSRSEVICFAAARDMVMRYVQLLNRCKLDVAGVHTESMATIWAYRHLNRREEDANAPTMYINLGWQGATVTISHGTRIVFSRYIHVGGHSFDQQIARIARCDEHEAAAQRHSLERPLTRAAARAPAAEAPAPVAAARTAGPPSAVDSAAASATVAERRLSATPDDLIPVPMCATAPAIIDRYRLGELVDTVVDEISMCLRYHRGVFANLPVTRAIFVGGDARQAWLTRTIADHLSMNAYVGDPLRRFAGAELFTPGLNLAEPRPGWSVACGLCHAPSDQ